MARLESGHVQVVVTSGGGFKDWTPSSQPPLTAPPRLAAAPPPAAGSACGGKTGWLVFSAVLTAVIAAAITLVVLGVNGKLGGAGTGADRTYFQAGTRQRNYTAEPAFYAELHSWLTPMEVAEEGLPPTDADVIVIGGGVAGLTAAQTLHRASLSVIVVEARDRLGGRVHSLPLGGGAWAELGASHIWGSASGIDLLKPPPGKGAQPPQPGNPITQLANQAELPRVITDPRSQAVYGASAAKLSSRESSQLAAWLADFAALVSLAPANQSLADVAARLLAARALEGGSRELLEAAVAASIPVRYGGGPLDSLSALYYDNSSSFGGVDSLVVGGYSRVVDLLAAELPDVRLDSPVAGISHGDSLATVSLTTGQSLTAQYVVCTVPLGVLKHSARGALLLDPPLPLDTAAAVDALGVGLVNKVVLVFEQASCSDVDGVFWDTAESIIAASPDQDACAWPVFTNLDILAQVPGLVAHACGQWAAAAEGWSDEAVVASAMAVLRALYPQALAAPVYAAVSRWGSDPYSLGSDSYYAVGSTPSHRATLAEPVSGSLLLAGEHTSVSYPATVHGAYLSGTEAAQRVLDSLLLPADCEPDSSKTVCYWGGWGTTGSCADECWGEAATDALEEEAQSPASAPELVLEPPAMPAPSPQSV